MRKLFKNHFIYTFVVGLIGFVWVFGQPPLRVPAPVEQAQRSSVETQAASRQDREPEPVEPVTVITKQTASVQSQPGTAGAEPGDITATLTRLSTAGTLETAGQMLRVAADNLRMRAGPSSQASTLGAYPLGTQVEMLARSGGWVEVRNLADGTVGWMFAEYLAEAE